MAEGIEFLGEYFDMSSLPSSASRSKMEIEARHLSSHWRRCSLSSDHWAQFYSMHFPEHAKIGDLNRTAAENTFSYLLNELFENCAKFSEGEMTKVFFEALVQPETVVFQLTNHITPRGKLAFVHLLQEILDGDPEELYFERLERNAESGEGGSGLGYLTLIKDYGVRFGFKFTPLSSESIRVDVQAHVMKKES